MSGDWKDQRITELEEALTAIKQATIDLQKHVTPTCWSNYDWWNSHDRLVRIIAQSVKVL